MSFVNAGGHRLHYEWHGPGPGTAPALVFLHEGLGCVSMWRDFPARLAEATGCGAMVYSRWGYGRSDAIDQARPVSFMHDEAEGPLPELLNHFGIEDAILVGHSDGASISLIYTGRIGKYVRALILEAPHVYVEDFNIRSIEEIKTVYETTDLRDRLARHHGDNVDSAFRGWNDVWLDPEFRKWNIEDCLPGVRVPTLVIQGRDDQYGTADQVDAVCRQVAGPCETLLLAECGHSPHREQTEATFAAMKSFIDRVRAGDLAA